jgi:hypothetical protein
VVVEVVVTLHTNLLTVVRVVLAAEVEAAETLQHLVLQELKILVVEAVALVTKVVTVAEPLVALA